MLRTAVNGTSGNPAQPAVLGVAEPSRDHRSGRAEPGGSSVIDLSKEVITAVVSSVVVLEQAGEIYIGDSGGTSASTPFWAGIIALADQYAGHSLGFVNSAL